jgi:hypothetical protein
MGERRIMSYRGAIMEDTSSWIVVHDPALHG